MGLESVVVVMPGNSEGASARSHANPGIAGLPQEHVHQENLELELVQLMHPQ